MDYTNFLLCLLAAALYIAVGIGIVAGTVPEDIPLRGHGLLILTLMVLFWPLVAALVISLFIASTVLQTMRIVGLRLGIAAARLGAERRKARTPSND